MPTYRSHLPLSQPFFLATSFSPFTFLQHRSPRRLGEQVAKRIIFPAEDRGHHLVCVTFARHNTWLAVYSSCVQQQVHLHSRLFDFRLRKRRAPFVLIVFLCLPCQEGASESARGIAVSSITGTTSRVCVALQHGYCSCMVINDTPV